MSSHRSIAAGHGLATLVLLLGPVPALAQQEPAAETTQPRPVYPTGAYVGATAVLARDVAGDIALFGEWRLPAGPFRLRLRTGYAERVVDAGGESHAGMLRDPTVHGWSVDARAMLPLRVGPDRFLSPYIDAGVNFADWSAEELGGEREAGAVLFAAAGARALSYDLHPDPRTDLRLLADAAIFGRRIRSGIGRNAALRQQLLRSTRRDFAGIEVGVGVQTAWVRPRVRLTWIPPGADGAVPGLTDTRLSFDLEVRAPLP